MKDGLAWNKKHYNVSNFEQYDLTPAPFLVSNLHYLKENNSKLILDAGCGQGRNLLFLLENGFEVIGVDGAPNALQVASDLLRSKKMKKYTLINQELQDISKLKNETVDAIVSITVLTHIFDPEKVIGEFSRILKKDGLLIVDFATIRDSTYEYISKGTKLGQNMFLEQGTKVKYIEDKKEIIPLFKAFEIISINEESFIEPGHPGSRPFEHEHSSYVVIAKKK
ncbi:MAG: class I SAM-dependent methyltransferase [Candidatus ainarchaeum sp.]|nr:class I SAM-dependent methyltransferase [Candidatus ainarchaeum sp.]